MNQDLTPKQQTSEAIRQAESILILTAQHPNIDQAASVIALAAVLRKFGKKVSAIVTDPVPHQLSFLGEKQVDTKLGGLRDFILKVDLGRAEADSLRYERENDKLNIYIKPARGGFAPSDVTFGYGDYHYDLAIVLGVPTRNRIDKVYADNQKLFDRLPIVNLDFHRSNENFGAINLIEPTASSLSEMLVALAESLQNGIIDTDIATAMLAGLMASTDRFTASHTTAKSLTVAAQLMAAGAKQPQIVRAIFRDSRAAQQQDRREQEQTQQPRESNRDRDNQRDQEPAQETAPKEQPVQERTVEVPAEVTMPEAPEMTYAPEPTPAPAVVLPQNVRPADEPIIDPSHIELLAAPAEGQVPMADFSAAAEILQRRMQENATAQVDED